MPEQIIVGAGTEYLCGLLVQLLGFDKTYAMEEPGYGKIHKIYKSHGIDCRKVPMDECGISVSQLTRSDNSWSRSTNFVATRAVGFDRSDVCTFIES